MWFEGGSDPAMDFNGECLGLLAHHFVTVLQQGLQLLQYRLHLNHLGTKVPARCGRWLWQWCLEGLFSEKKKNKKKGKGRGRGGGGRGGEGRRGGGGGEGEIGGGGGGREGGGRSRGGKGGKRERGEEKGGK